MNASSPIERHACRDTEPHAAHTYLAPTGHGVEYERRHCDGVCPSWCRDHDVYVDSEEVTVTHRHWFGPYVQLRELVTSGAGPRERGVELSDDLEYLTAPAARQLAAQLVEATDLLDTVGGAYTNDSTRLEGAR